MQALNVLLLSLVFVQNFSSLCGTEENNEGGGSFIPQSDGSMKWMSDENTHTQMRNVLKGFQPVEDINFYLYTRANRKVSQELLTDDIESVKASLFNPQNPTKIIIHGWMSNSGLEVCSLIRDAYLSVGPHNIIVVDWVTQSVGPYLNAFLSIPGIGKAVAAFIDFMAMNDCLKPENLTIIGHSMGAQICGVAGRCLKSGQLHSIIALDPASPMFPYNSTEGRLSPSDAFYVESIQTNGGMSGYVQPVGKATFYPNGGQTQPGCGLDPFGSCAHFRSYRFFAKAIKMNGFPCIKCCNYKFAVAKNCGSKFSKEVRMGAPSNAYCASGVYYVPVRGRPPYAVEQNKI